MTNEYSSKAEAILRQCIVEYDTEGLFEAGVKYHDEKLGEYLKAITDLITQAQIEARIDELEMIDSRGELYASYMKKRYDELQSTLKKEQ